MEEVSQIDRRPQTSGSGRGSHPSRPFSKNGPTHDQIGEQDLVAQLSLAPATQTTVVTTITTTTVNLPPLTLPAPHRNHQVDPKQYPLHNSPTPLSLRNISFKHGGKLSAFQEAQDSNKAVQNFLRERKNLQRANGVLQTIQTNGTSSELRPPHPSTSLSRDRQAPEPRPASPESTMDYEYDEEHAAASRQTKRRRTTEIDGHPVLPAHSRLNGLMSSPITPESQPRQLRASRRSTRHATHQTRNAEAVLPSPSLEQPSTFASGRELSPGSFIQENDGDMETDIAMASERTSGLQSNHRGASHDTTVPTPPVESDEGRRPLSRRALSSIPARLHVTESPSAQDGSLPSPSLSPVTAAATLQHRGYFGDLDSNSEYASQLDSPVSGHPLRHFGPIGTSANIGEPSQQLSPSDETVRPPNFGSSLSEIPAMIDYFEAIPDELKGYVMHQLLRRCPKPTLHLIADVVNPALKCDFLSDVPPELRLYIIKHLDLKSLCKAAQVSKTWRSIVLEHDNVWKELFKADGYTLPEGEMQRAVIENWGWQDPHGINGHEMNLSDTVVDTWTGASSPTPSVSNSLSSVGPLRRSERKRKATTAFSAKQKQSKRKRAFRGSREASLDISVVDQGDLHSNLGLLSLKTEQPHLYKSLYRRHHLIRRNWMYEDTKPRHIAFRAHDTHVVTCLQFDGEKILTGSDDNNINIYDTRTGALKGVLEGHEGGVWALQYEGNTLVSGSTDRSVRVWDIEKAEPRQVFRGHTSTVRCLQIVSPVKIGVNADGQSIMMPKQPLIVTGSRDSTLRIWKLPKPDDPVFMQQENENDPDDNRWFVRILTGHQHSVRAIAAHGDTLVSGSYDCTVRVWKISTGESTLTLRGHAQKVYSVVLDHVRNRCISGSMDNMVRIWDLDNGSLRYSLEGHSSLVGLLDLQCDRLVSAAADSTLRIWDPENGSCKATLTAHTGAITCFQHDGQKVISGSDRTLKLWDIRRGECVKDLLSDLSGVWQVRFDERRCVSAVQRDGVTYIEVLDFGAARDGVPEHRRGRRVVVDAYGSENVSGGNEDRFDLDGNNDS